MARIDFAPEKLDLTGIPAGDNITMRFKFRRDGAPLDTNGATIVAHIKQTALDTDAVIEPTLTPLNHVNGEWSMAISGADTATLMDGVAQWRGVWDLEITESGQTEPRTLVGGSVTFVTDVTRP